MNTPQEAVQKAKSMIDSGYVYAYGFKNEIITQKKIDQFARMYPSTYTVSIKNKTIEKIGKIGIDCSGFVCEAFGYPHTNSSGLKSKMVHAYSTSDKSKLKNGMIIWRKGHIGLIEIDQSGEAWILEAKGTAYDLTRTKYSERGTGFTYYGELAGVDYSNARVYSSTSSPIATSRPFLREFIDVSHHNTINLALTAQKYKDVIIRVGYRAYASGILTLDKKFLQHAQTAINSGMRIGVYFYDQAINEEEAIQQADWVIGLIKPLPISFPVMLDTEYSNKNKNGRADNISKEQRTKNIIAFCERVTAHGYFPGVYASENWFDTMVDFNRLKKYFIWVAKYSSTEPKTSKYEIWQHGATEVPGSASPIDINKLYLDFPTIPPYGSANSIVNNPVVNPPIQETISPSVSQLVINNIVTASSLNVRNKANVLGTIVGGLKRNDKVEIFEYQNGWVKIDPIEDKWCSYKYINSTKGKVGNCNKLNCRKEPVNGTISFVLVAGSEVNILRQDESTGWYYIEFQGKTGYVSNKYIT